MVCSSVLLNSAKGDVIVDVQDASITAGGTGFVDVLIDITGGDNLDFANYDFLITPVSGGSALDVTRTYCLLSMRAVSLI